MALSKRLRSVIIAACGTTLLVTGTLVGNPLAMADPLSDAQAQLDEIEAQRSAIEQSYNDSQLRQSKAEAQKESLSSDIADTQTKIDAMKPAAIYIVQMQQQGAGIDLTASFLLNDSPENFLSQMQTAATVTSLINDQLSSYVSQINHLNALNETLAGTINDIKAEVATQQKLLAAAQVKEAAAQTVVNRLTSQQRMTLQAKQQVVSPQHAAASSSRAQTVLNFALAQVGKGYIMGTAGPVTFDCSGLVMAAYAKVGIYLPHSSREQFNYGTPVARADLQPGDLLFFYSPIHHVGMYIGNGMMVHASNPRTGVHVTPIQGSYSGARRLI